MVGERNRLWHLPHYSNTTWFVRRIGQSWSRSRPIWYAQTSKSMCDTLLGPGECCCKGSVGQAPWEGNHITETLERFPPRLMLPSLVSFCTQNPVGFSSFAPRLQQFWGVPQVKWATYMRNPDGQAMQTLRTSRTAGRTCGHLRPHAG